MPCPRPAHPRQYSLTLYAQKTGAYRLTARYKVTGSTNWNWYSTNAPYTTGNRRDFGIVVSPKKALGMVVYELAVNNIGAQGSFVLPAQHFHRSLQRPGVTGL